MWKSISLLIFVALLGWTMKSRRVRSRAGAPANVVSLDAYRKKARPDEASPRTERAGLLAVRARIDARIRHLPDRHRDAA